MAKSMALVANGVVVNVLWCSDRESETETLIDTADRPVAIGDSYERGKFYRNGEEVLTPLEEARKQLEETNKQKVELEKLKFKYLMEV